MSAHVMPSPEPIFDSLFAYQRSAALKAAVELEIFTVIDEGAHTAAAIAKRTNAAERGVRILCDYLTVYKLLAKSDGAYHLVPESAAFLSKKSPAYLGSVARFLVMPELAGYMHSLADTVRRGGVADSGHSSVADDNPIWIEFARSMMPMMIPNAHAIAELAGGGTSRIKVLDIAAGHGAFGIAIAQRNPNAEIVAVDWKAVLAVAEEHAQQAGVLNRYRTIAGDAFKVDWGGGYDVALVTNFLHHYDAATCTTLLTKIHASLNPGGQVVVLEFVPNPDRVSPPLPASFSLTMLADTVAGDAYTFAELRDQLERAGFSDVSSHPTPTPETVVIGRKG
ncbi:MAG TPA: class I SAM-dependent methyltransferase [Vicinamibacterales bacterium]|nr:class I SAM-dependent methyltransferase [Vicinamibacterales bacterium]